MADGEGGGGSASAAMDDCGAGGLQVEGFLCEGFLSFVLFSCFFFLKDNSSLFLKRGF